MNPALENALSNALAGMQDGPKSLKAHVTFYAQQENAGNIDVEAAIIGRLATNPNDGIRKLFNRQLSQWGQEPTGSWTDGTAANTEARRSRVYDLLQIGKKLRLALHAWVPPYLGPGNILVDNSRTPKDWYTPDFRKNHNFYWKRVRTFLESVRGIPEGSLASIDTATTTIMERLADPSAESARKSRGLVVGYVQSGKTTNFTGVIAKAVDAGYRLIIVLSGTTNLLRNQTQRRLDMDLVGRENILDGSDEEEFRHDYNADPDWPEKFISYGQRPSLAGHVDITRLTGTEDFESASTGIKSLSFDFEKKNKKVGLFKRENLDHAGARIIVIKKNVDRLTALLEALEDVSKAKCAEIPALVVDDESDQAAVNTVDPKKVTDKERSSINSVIVKILDRLPRAQYIGYTATPFANVFVDPHDPKDIYPRDFIMSLDRPEGYMGAREFHDLDAPLPGRMTNEAAYIRSIHKSDTSDSDRLVDAMDCFVLSGALKKFRERGGKFKFKHHTMLFHTSSFKAEQIDSSEKIRDLWQLQAYGSPGASMKRLKLLLEDFRTVRNDRAKELPFPRTFEDLKPSLGKAIAEIQRHIPSPTHRSSNKISNDPVLMINSAEDADTPDFDAKEGVWKIFVGGAKLSRGYTIEGLTVSYFLRAAKLQDTLMQMGRWFGYRHGYQDTIRLFIGRDVAIGKTTLDLYEAFQDMCRDEEDFREQLSMYSGDERFTPYDVPALVFNTHPQLRPTSKNKMFNAHLQWAGFSYREPTNPEMTSEGLKSNAKLFAGLIGSKSIKSAVFRTNDDGRGATNLKWFEATDKDLMNVLEKARWDKTGQGRGIKASTTFLRKYRPVDSWIVVMPQLGERAKGGLWNAGKEQFSCIRRTWLGTRFNVFSTPPDVRFAKWLVGGQEPDIKSSQLKPRKRTGVMLLYPTRQKLKNPKVDNSVPAMGFALVLPTEGADRHRMAFSVEGQSKKIVGPKSKKKH